MKVMFIASLGSKNFKMDYRAICSNVTIIDFDKWLQEASDIFLRDTKEKGVITFANIIKI